MEWYIPMNVKIVIVLSKYLFMIMKINNIKGVGSMLQVLGAPLCFILAILMLFVPTHYFVKCVRCGEVTNITKKEYKEATDYEENK